MKWQSMSNDSGQATVLHNILIHVWAMEDWRAQQFFKAIPKFFGQQPAAENENLLNDKNELIPSSEMKVIIGWGESGKAILNETL